MPTDAQGSPLVRPAREEAAARPNERMDERPKRPPGRPRLSRGQRIVRLRAEIAVRQAELEHLEMEERVRSTPADPAW
jgi:hypothetical protein